MFTIACMEPFICALLLFLQHLGTMAIRRPIACGNQKFFLRFVAKLKQKTASTKPKAPKKRDSSKITFFFTKLMTRFSLIDFLERLCILIAQFRLLWETLNFLLPTFCGTVGLIWRSLAWPSKWSMQDVANQSSGLATVILELVAFFSLCLTSWVEVRPKPAQSNT